MFGDRERDVCLGLLSWEWKWKLGWLSQKKCQRVVEEVGIRETQTGDSSHD